MTEQQRAEFRAFVRENHPDRGGDPEVFIAGLARFGTGGFGTDSVGTAAPSASGADGADRYDAPIEVVATLPFPVRVGVALIRTWRRRHHRRVQ